MPWWIARRAAPAIWRRVPWKMVGTIALWLGNKGREHVQGNLSEREQHEFWNLLKRSRGRPSTLTQHDRTRLRNIVGTAIRGTT